MKIETKTETVSIFADKRHANRKRRQRRSDQLPRQNSVFWIPAFAGMTRIVQTNFEYALCPVF